MTPDVSSDVPVQDTQPLMDFVLPVELDVVVPDLVPVVEPVLEPPAEVPDGVPDVLPVVAVLVAEPVEVVVVPVEVVVVPVEVVVVLPVRSTDPEAVPVDPETLVDVLDELSLEPPPIEPQALKENAHARDMDKVRSANTRAPANLNRFNNIHPMRLDWNRRVCRRKPT